MPKRWLGLGLIFSLCFWGASDWQTTLYAQEKLTGEQIARQVFDRDRGNTSNSTAIMVLIDKTGYKVSRTFSSLRILNKGLEKQLIRFLSPNDIEGTGFLTVEKEGYKTDQFIYLSALRRTRRIVSSQKHHRFVQTDFTYEDMERQPVENYLYKLKGKKTISNIDCYVLETRPKPSVKSQYSLTKSFITTTGFVPILAEYFDQKGKHTKTYTVLKLENKQNIWTEIIVKMEDFDRKHQTLIKTQHIEYNIKIDPERLSKSALENY
ncbi:MAG: outer membrane lipoprotein-sorting protein [Desulfobacula sp.]|nr:outer membrane lipoprotein-sorting protein [Desulfobacula sp.]